MMMQSHAWVARLIAIVFLGLSISLAQAETLTGEVVKIADGDTLAVLDALRQQHRIRLTGIDAPEKSQAFGTVSRQHLAALVFGRTVIVEWHKRDRYQRILGKVLLNGEDINLEQIRAGLAWHYSRYAKDQLPVDRERYALAEVWALDYGVIGHRCRPGISGASEAGWRILICVDASSNPEHACITRTRWARTPQGPNGQGGIPSRSTI